MFNVQSTGISRRERERDRQTDRQTDRETDRQTDGRTDRQTDRESLTHAYSEVRASAAYTAIARLPSYENSLHGKEIKGA